MTPIRAAILGLLGILLAAALAMGALAIVREGLDEPSDVADFPALVTPEDLLPPPSSPTARPTGAAEGQETASPSPTATAAGTRDGDADGGAEERGDDDD